MKNVITAFVTILYLVCAHCQEKSNRNTVLPSIMILPGKSEFKDVKNIEIPFNLKVGMATVNDAMKNFGFDTKDFEASYNKLRRDGKLDGCETCELRELFFAEATADVLVELEFEYVETANGNKVTVIVEAFHFSTSTSWGSEVCESNYMYTNDISSLTKAAINMRNYVDDEGNDLSYIDHFMFEIIEYLDKCSDFGAVADLRISIDSDAGCDFNCKLNDTRLKYLLEDWAETNAKNGDYNIQSASDFQIIFDVFKYDCDKKPTAVGRKLSRFLDELGLEFNLTQSRSTIYVTLLKI